MKRNNPRRIQRVPRRVRQPPTSRPPTTPPIRPQDSLRHQTEPPSGPIYRSSRGKLLTLKKYMQDNLDKDIIRDSSFPAGFPILFIKKAHLSLQLGLNYQGLNAIGIHNRYPLPLIEKTLNRLSKAQWYSQLALLQGYDQIRMTAGKESKTAFHTREGHLEYTVMPFGLTNPPTTFQQFINNCLMENLDILYNAYLAPSSSTVTT